MNRNNEPPIGPVIAISIVVMAVVFILGLLIQGC
jgi:hypothetical protein